MRPNPAPGLAWPPLALALILALGWASLVRVPLVLNAPSHLDSDLAVDGLTLRDAVAGHWRWHYPGTPYMGSLPVLLSWVQARLWGVGPITLVSGGVVAHAALIVATFGLNRQAFGSRVAAWGLVPLAFASTGVVWLSGRITGGHLLTAAWHAGAFALLCGSLRRGGIGRSAGLGLWCGLGLWLDSMFAVTWLGLIPAAIAGWWGLRERGKGRPLACVLAFAMAAGVGMTPRFLGARIDPHDAYGDQFAAVTRGDVLVDHARILFLDCLPRLIAGHRLPGFQSDPAGKLSDSPLTGRPASFDWLGPVVATAALGLLGPSLVAFCLGPGTRPLSTSRTMPVVDPPPQPSPLVGEGWGGGSGAVRLGLFVSSTIVVIGFIINRNIFNSDNYRYLVFLLVPWSSGFGLLMARWSARGVKGTVAAGLVALGFAALMTADSARWYFRFGWIEESGRPVGRAPVDPALGMLAAHPEVASFFGDYWDVYRLAFLSGGRVQGVPFPEYPDRFPEVARSLPGGRPRTLLVRPGPIGPAYRARALRDGGREIDRASGLSLVDWPPGEIKP